tara:strand:- start:364 stop:783 length:420 start_codon:yes stop_codon:yes gene_type:complete
MILYHISPYKRRLKIRREGLKPPTFLSGKRDLSSWLMSALINFYNTGRGGTLSLYEVNIPNNWFYDGSQVFKRNANIGPEYVIGEDIDKTRVKSVGTVRVKDTVERGIKEGWLIQVMPSGKEVKPKWKSRIRKQFARIT